MIDHRRRRAVWVILAGVVGLAVPGVLSIGLQAPAGAFVETFMELDGNAFANTSNKLDWSCYVGTLAPSGSVGSDPNCPSVVTAPDSSSGLLTDVYNASTDDMFGQTKDPDPISAWEWKQAGANPEKNDIQHAAVMSFPSGSDTIAYFMADRSKVQGSAFLGFWFFRSEVGPNPIPPSATTGTFSGAHVSRNTTTGARGDVLVLANFVQGNNNSSTVTTAVYEWDVSCTSANVAGCGAANLRILQGPTASNCVGGSLTQPVCAVFNQTQIPSPWPYDPSGPNAPNNQFDGTAFTEGGINFTQIFGGNDCISSFLVETRTSDSVTAELTDFVSGDLNTCGRIKIVKDAVPDAAQDFGFTATTPTGETKIPANFALDDDADGALSNTAEFDNVRPGTYTFTEAATTGWNLTSVSCVSDQRGTLVTQTTPTVSVSLERGETITCTYTNTKPAHLQLIKQVVNNAGGTAAPSDFTLSAAGPTPISGAGGVSAEVNVGSYTLSETTLPGYTAGSWSCTGASSFSGSTVNLVAGDNAICTIINDDQQAYITVNKTVVNNNGGSAVADDFDLTLEGTPVSSGVAVPVDPGTYTADETLLPGYSFAGFTGDCDGNGDITVALGESKQCTLTNDDQQSYVTVVKVVDNSNGGTALPDDFKLTLDGNPVLSGAANAVNPGDHQAGESLLPGYEFDGYSGDCDDTGLVTVALGQSKTCTLTNDDQQAYIIVNKVVINDSGGKAAPNDFELTVDGNAASHGVAFPVNPGTHTVDETLLPGYTFEGFTGDCDTSGSVTVALGQTKTCTLTNDDQQAYVIVEKNVINDNGGSAAADDFKLTLDGTPTTSGTAIPVNPGTYRAGESLLSGYTFVGFSGACDSNGDVAVALGETKTCTLTNDDQQSYVKVVKEVVNDNGGSAAADDFKLTLNGDATTSGTLIAVNPGSHTAGETLLSGYTFVGFSGDCDTNGVVNVALGQTKTCTLTNDDNQSYVRVIKSVTNDSGGAAQPDDFALTLNTAATTSGFLKPVNPGTYTAAETQVAGYTFEGFTGDCNTSGSMSVALGETKTCTLTNNDNQSYITVVKEVVNDNGGTATPNQFSLTLEGNAVSSGVAVPVNPGTYTAGETLLAGYSFAGFSGDCDGNGDVTVTLGQSKTCTLTNNDIEPRLTLIKTVINDDGGDLVVADFPLFVNTTSVTSGVTKGFNAGTYTASETTQDGYTPSAWGGDCAADGSITLSIGDNKTCTITNDDQPAFITVNKVVNNNFGGTAVADDFALTLEGQAVESGVAVQVNPGTHTAAETLLDGYSFEGFSGDCVGNGDVTVALGETKTCTLTNNDIQPRLTLIKTVTNDNGGSKVVADFPLFVDTTSVTSGVANGLNAGTYTASETTSAGYTPSVWSGACAANGSVTLSIGDDKTCYITNDDQQAYIIVNKVVTNDDGGTAIAADFNLTLDTNPVASGDLIPVSPGTHTAAETQLDGYTFEGFTGDCGANGEVTVALGETKICTLTNNDEPAYIIVNKVVINDNGGTADKTDFALRLEGQSVTTGVAVQVDPGTYTASETQVNGYSFFGFSGDCDGNGDVTVKLGETKTCTLTNNDIQPRLTLTKTVINDDGGTKVVSDFPLFVNATSVTSGEANGFNAGSYTASETTSYGYTASAWGGDCAANGSITLSIGDTKTCTITNDDQPGRIVVIKNAKPAQGTFSFSTTGDGYQSFTLTGATTDGGNQNSQLLDAGTYTVREATQLGWILTGLGGSTDPLTPYACVVTGTGGSSGTGDLNTQTATIDLRNGDTVTCTFENTGNGATRTQGFWSTHPQLAALAWNGGSGFGHTFPGVEGTAGIGDRLICGRSVDADAIIGDNELMGGFWSDVAKTSTAKKRTSLDQAKMQLLQQLLAAELNASAFGSLPPGGVAAFASWESALCGTNATAVKNAQQQAASFNTSGDSAAFTPGTSASSKLARQWADIPFWNTLA